jgi:glutaredoxin
MKRIYFWLVVFLLIGIGLEAGPELQRKEKPSATLYYTANCLYCQQVLDYLRKIQKKIPMKDVKKDPVAKEELRRMGGLLEVPCLIIEGQALYSSETIIEWLQEHEEELEDN